MNRWSGYFKRSLAGYFLERLGERLALARMPGTIDYHGVRLSVEGMAPAMKVMFLKDRYEVAEGRICDALLCHQDVVLEIGAAIGFVSLYCLKEIGVRRVVCVEGNPATCLRLEQNYRLNGLVPILLRGCLAERDGTVDMVCGEDFWNDRVASAGEGAAPASTTPVPGFSIESLLAQSPDCTALVVDIEGSEACVRWEALPDRVKKVVVELHPRILGDERAYRVLASLLRLDFDVKMQLGDVWGLTRP